MKTRVLIASAAALALAACGSNEETTEAPDAEDIAVAPADPAAEPDPATPQGFVAMAASSDRYEIEAGRLAQEMGRDQAIKDFGEMMVMDHASSSEKMRAAVAEGGASLSIPPEMLPKHQQQLAALRNAGDNFDSVYAQQQVAAHQEALNLLQDQAETGTVESLKMFAAEIAPVVEGHLERARDLAGGTGGAE